MEPKIWVDTLKDGSKVYHARKYKDGIRYCGTGTTEAKARKALGDKLKEGKKRALPQSKQRLETFFEDWFASREHGWSPNTKAGYRDHWERYIKPALGDYRLDELNLQILDKWASGIKAPSYRYACVARLKSCLQQAVDYGILDVSPARLLKNPKPDREEPKRYDRAEVVAFRDAALRHNYHAYFALALAFPARPGEILGLRWPDIDLDKKTVHIVRSRSTFANRTIEGKPKNKTSRRLVHLPDWVVVDLKRWRTEQKLDRVNLGPAWQGEDYVCTGPKGKPLHERVVRRVFDELAAKAGCTDITLYQLRHTAVSNLMDAGASRKQVQKAGGYKTPLVMEETYWQLAQGQEEEAADMLANFYFGGTGATLAAP